MMCALLILSLTFVGCKPTVEARNHRLKEDAASIGRIALSVALCSIISMSNSFAQCRCVVNVSGGLSFNVYEGNRVVDHFDEVTELGAIRAQSVLLTPNL
jgi:hypothetical protein